MLVMWHILKQELIFLKAVHSSPPIEIEMKIGEMFSGVAGKPVFGRRGVREPGSMGILALGDPGFASLLQKKSSSEDKR